MNSKEIESQKARIRVLVLPENLESVFEIVKELRPHLDLSDFKRYAMLAQAADGYRIVVSEDKGEMIAMMGYRILHDLAHGSHLYIDDLVTKKSARSKGHGAALLKFAEAECRRLGLASLRLCTGIDNKEAQKFYIREGWENRSLAYKKKVPSH